MKITIVTKNLCAGGAERVISELLKEWVLDTKNECNLILLENVEDFYKVPDNVKIIRMDTQHNNPILNKLLLYKKVRDNVKKIEPDIVLSFPEEIGIYVIGALLGTKIKVVVSERNNPRVMPYKKITRLLRKILYPYGDGFIFQTKQAAEFFSKRIQHKGTILPNPLDISRIPCPYENNLEHIVVAAGRFEKQKNFKLLIDAFSIFQQNHPLYKLVIYGDGSLRRELTNYAKERLLTDSFLFPGRNDNLLSDMQKCEIFVLSSDFEGSPNVLIEAMACGMAVISTNYSPGGVNQIIENEVNGLIINVGDINELVQSLERLANDKKFANCIRNNAVLIKNRFDSKIVSEKWLSFLKSI